MFIFNFNLKNIQNLTEKKENKRIKNITKKVQKNIMEQAKKGKYCLYIDWFSNINKSDLIFFEENNFKIEKISGGWRISWEKEKKYESKNMG